MKIIQFILAPALMVLTVLYFQRFRSLLVDCLLIITMGMTGTLFVIFPGITVKAANLLGVGRGADLVIYFTLVGLVFICLMLFSKIRKLEEQLTRLIRSNALEHSKSPDK